MVFAAIFAVFGVQAVIGAAHRKQYAEAHVTAAYFLVNGNEIKTSVERLSEVNVRDLNLVKDADAALGAGDRSGFKRLMAQAGVFNVEQVWLQQKVQEYQAGFDKAANR
jgi:hypothetical protein